jgi:predicted acylesterase/phospholipase RssA
MKNIVLSVVLLIVFIIISSCDIGHKENSEDDLVVSKNLQKKTLILTIDGGGIKGILPAYFLTQVEAKLQKKSYQLFDVIGGTSTGGIISIGLTTPYYRDLSPRTANEVLNFYLNDCGKIFYKNHQPFGPSYYANTQGKGVEAFLQSQLLPTSTLGYAALNLPNKKTKQVFTTAYVVNSTGGNITNPKMGVDFGPYLFNWYDAIHDTSQNYRLWEAARATSAAPTYFPIAHVGGGSGVRSNSKEKWAVDGGVMSNDPAIWGVSEALRTGIAKSLDDIVVISLGCGIDRYNGGINVTSEQKNHQPYGQKYGFWGSPTWAGPDLLENLNGDDIGDPAILQILSYANQFVPASQLEIVSKGTALEYYRVQLDLPSNLTAMDECGNVNKLHAFAKSYFSSSQGIAILNQVVNVINANL